MEIPTKFSIHLIIAIICMINSCASDLNQVSKKVNNTQQQFNNFLIIDHLSDNEKETRIKWKDLMGKQTSLDVKENERFVNR